MLRPEPGIYETPVGGKVELGADGRLSIYGTVYLAGSASSVKDGVEKAMRLAGCSLAEAIRMVATNRLTGHSPGFFSVYRLPPNPAVSPEDQIRINARLKQEPEYRDIRALILKKSMQLQGRLGAAERWRLRKAATEALLLSKDARATADIPSNSVQLTVTSPPFLDVVQYARDNWLRCWFNGFDAEKVGQSITMSRTVEEWSEEMSGVFRELHRITRPGGWVALEVGEVRRGTVKLDEVVAPIGIPPGLFDDPALKLELVEEAALRQFFGKRSKDTHKGTYGHVLIVAGSVGKSGAAALAGRAALRTGTGLVTVATAAAALPSIARATAELMTEPLASTPEGLRRSLH